MQLSECASAQHISASAQVDYGERILRKLSSLEKKEEDAEEDESDDSSWLKQHGLKLGGVGLAFAGVCLYFFNKKTNASTSFDANRNDPTIHPNGGNQGSNSTPPSQVASLTPNASLEQNDSKKQERKEPEESKERSFEEKKASPEVTEALKKHLDEMDHALLKSDTFFEAVSCRNEKLSRSSGESLDKLFELAKNQFKTFKTSNERFRSREFISFFDELKKQEHMSGSKDKCFTLFNEAANIPERDFFFTYSLLKCPILLKYMVVEQKALNVNGFGPRGNTCLHHLYATLTQPSLSDPLKGETWKQFNLLLSYRADPFLENSFHLAIADRVRHHYEKKEQYERLLSDEHFKKFEEQLRDVCLNMQNYQQGTRGLWANCSNFPNIVGWSQSKSEMRKAVVMYGLKCLEDEFEDRKTVQQRAKEFLCKHTERIQDPCSIIVDYCLPEIQNVLAVGCVKDEPPYNINTNRDERFYLLSKLVTSNVNNENLLLLERSVSKAKVARIDLLISLGANPWLRGTGNYYAFEWIVDNENNKMVRAKIANAMIRRRCIINEDLKYALLEQKNSIGSIDQRLFSYALETYRRCALEDIFQKTREKNDAQHDHDCQGTEQHELDLLMYIEALQGDNALCSIEYYFDEKSRKGTCLYEYMFKHKFPEHIVKKAFNTGVKLNKQSDNSQTFMHRLASNREMILQGGFVDRFKAYFDLFGFDTSEVSSLKEYWEKKLPSGHDLDDNSRKIKNYMGGCIAYIQSKQTALGST